MATPRLAHNVYFTLKDPTPANIAALVAACHQYLTVQPGIVFFAAGPRCEELARDVNVTDWHVGLHIVFIDKAAHDAYQDDPMHVKFVNDNRAGWSAVKVFDSLV